MSYATVFRSTSASTCRENVVPYQRVQKRRLAGTVNASKNDINSLALAIE